MFHESLQSRNTASSKPTSSDTENSVANDIGWQALGPAIAFTLIATFVVSLRWYTRYKISQCVGLDDYVVLISMVNCSPPVILSASSLANDWKLLSWAMTAIIAAKVNRGVGVYTGPVSVQTIAKLVVVANVVWILIVNITKASILIQYLRIFSNRITRSLCYVLMVMLLPAACWAIFGSIFLCQPVSKLWNPDLPGHCLSAQRYWLSVAGLDIGLDFLVLLLPLPAITALHLPRKQKLGLVAVFTLGFFVCAVSIVRFLTVLISSNQRDFVAAGIWAIIWSAIEANVGIICASLLALKPLVGEMFSSLVEETKPPRHSMRLLMVEARGDGDVLWQGSSFASAPPTPSTVRSSKEIAGMFKQSSAWRFGSIPPLAEVEDLTVIEPEDPPSPPPAAVAAQPGRERLSLFDMLQEDEEQARGKVRRKGS